MLSRHTAVAVPHDAGIDPLTLQMLPDGVGGDVAKEKSRVVLLLTVTVYVCEVYPLALACTVTEPESPENE